MLNTTSLWPERVVSAVRWGILRRLQVPMCCHTRQIAPLLKVYVLMAI